MHKVAIVGAGIGARHLEGYLSLPERYMVAAICDIDTQRAEPLAKKADARLEPDLGAILSDADIDIVDICLPPHLHFSTCKQVLEAGKHAVCEKPLVSSVAEADSLAKVAKEAGKKVFPVFQYRYGKGASQLRALIDAGLAGRPYVATLETHWNRPASYYEVDWRGTWEGERGGAILGHAIHIHDWLSFVLGPVDEVYARVDTRVNDIEVEDCASLSIRMESGALVTSSVTLGCATDMSRMRFCFEGLTAQSGLLPYAPADGEWEFIARAPTEQSAVDEVAAAVGSSRSWFDGMLEAVADALDGDGGREVTLEDARRSLEFISAVYHSARAGESVALPLGPDHPTYESWLPS